MNLFPNVAEWRRDSFRSTFRKVYDFLCPLPCLATLLRLGGMLFQRVTSQTTGRGLIPWTVRYAVKTLGKVPTTKFQSVILVKQATWHHVPLCTYFTRNNVTWINVSCMKCLFYIFIPVPDDGLVNKSKHVACFDIQYTDVRIYLTAGGLIPGGSSTAHICTRTIHRIQRTEHT
jgi:hypothetical protein